MDSEILSLQKNVKYNEWVTSRIEKLYWGALVSLTTLVVTRVVLPFQQGMTPVNELTIAVILGALSMQSYDFYDKLIVKLREDESGQKLSIGLVIVLLVLFIIGLVVPWLTLISIGIGFIWWKSYCLYRDAKTQKYGPISEKYFKRIRRIYLLLFILTLPLGLLADRGLLTLLPKDQSLPAYKDAKEKIDTLISGAYPVPDSLKQKVASLRENMDDLYSSWKGVKTQNSTIIFGGILVALLVIVYSAYKGALIRKSILTDEVLKELEAYYTRYYKEHPDNDPTKNSGGNSTKSGSGFITTCIAFFSTLRLFISSIAGIIAATVYFSTATTFSWKIAFLTFAVVALTSGYGFVLNDYVDIEKDRINHHDRALPSGRLSRKQVLIPMPLLIISSIFFAFYLPSVALLIDVITILLLSTYSFVNNKYGIWANAITALCSSFTIVFGMSVGGFSVALIFCAIGGFFMIFGREIVLDIRDLAADKAFRKTSVPIRYGTKGAINISMYLFIISSLFFAISSMTRGAISFTFFVGVSLNILLWTGFIYYRLNPTPSNMERFLVLTRIAFLCLLPALLL